MAIPSISTPVQADNYISLSPNSGYIGNEVAIFGAFDSHWGETVYIYYEVDDGEWQHVDTAEIDFDAGPSPDERTLVGASFDVPKSSSGEHEVRVCYGQSPSNKIGNAYTNFTVKPRVKITSPKNAVGSVGTEVQVEGTGFMSEERNIEILFSEVAVSTYFTADSYGTWTGNFEVPIATEGKHYVSARGKYTDEDDVKEASFTVEPGISLSVVKGFVGATTEVHGTGFFSNEPGIKVTYDGKEIGSSTTADGNGSWETTITIPPSTQGIHKIDAYGSSTTAVSIDARDFEVTPNITINPANGYVGTNIAVSGTGFTATTLVIITYDGDQQGSVTTDTLGSFSGISFKATHKQSVHTKDHPVEASCGTIQVSTTFSMEAESPPAPTLISPADGTRVGFVGEGTPTFEWQTVTDNSGINHYELRVSVDEGFSDLQIEQQLPPPDPDTGTISYIPDEALPYGTYYWQVRAIDNARNMGNWSDTYSFQAGLMTLAVFIIIIVVVVVAIGALIYFFIIRKRIPS